MNPSPDSTIFASLALFIALFVLTFYRLAKLNKTAQLRVRLAYFSLAVACVLGVASITLWGHDPTWVECAMIVSFCFVQGATMRAWEHGYPHSFTTGAGVFDDTAHEHEEHNRRAA
jgi:hypothetical protein